MEEEKKKKSGMSVAALTLGIISIIGNLFWYICLPTGILAIIFGAKTSKKIGSRLGKAGIVTGTIGLSICAFVYISITIIYVLSEIY